MSVVSCSRDASKKSDSSCSSGDSTPQPAAKMRMPRKGSAGPYGPGLRLRRRLTGLRWRFTGLRRRLARRLDGLIVLLSQLGNRHRAIVTLNVDQLDALRRAADRPDALRRHPQDLSLLGNEHQLVIVMDLGDADDL